MLQRKIGIIVVYPINQMKPKKYDLLRKCEISLWFKGLGNGPNENETNINYVQIAFKRLGPNW